LYGHSLFECTITHSFSTDLLVHPWTSYKVNRTQYPNCSHPIITWCRTNRPEVHRPRGKDTVCIPFGFSTLADEHAGWLSSTSRSAPQQRKLLRLGQTASRLMGSVLRSSGVEVDQKLILLLPVRLPVPSLLHHSLLICFVCWAFTCNPQRHLAVSLIEFLTIIGIYLAVSFSDALIHCGSSGGQSSVPTQHFMIYHFLLEVQIQYMIC